MTCKIKLCQLLYIRSRVIFSGLQHTFKWVLVQVSLCKWEHGVPGGPGDGGGGGGGRRTWKDNNRMTTGCVFWQRGHKLLRRGPRKKKWCKWDWLNDLGVSTVSEGMVSTRLGLHAWICWRKAYGDIPARWCDDPPQALNKHLHHQLIVRSLKGYWNTSWFLFFCFFQVFYV